MIRSKRDSFWRRCSETYAAEW